MGVGGVGASEMVFDGVPIGPVPYLACKSAALSMVYRSGSGVVERVASADIAGDLAGDHVGDLTGEGVAEKVSGVAAGVTDRVEDDRGWGSGRKSWLEVGLPGLLVPCRTCSCLTKMPIAL